ncbi:MAG: single-stranded DNA-binding protein [Pseudonocardiaceae bacterium]|nr:single-stranded DNA-binding protein [Pseudonocardiaceae bacterium]
MNETYVTVVGRVVGEISQRTTREGHKMASFRVATNERRYDKAIEQWVDKNPMFLEVICWRRLAAGVGTSLNKGDPVVVTGRLHQRDYEVEGQRRSKLELDAQAVGPDLSWCTADVQRARRDGAPAVESATNSAGVDESDSTVSELVA